MKPIYEFAGFRLDLANKTLLHNGIQVPLTPKAFDTLTLLVERSGQLVEKDEFMRQLWPETFVEDAVLADNISRLRRALGDRNGSRLIVTVPKRGYRFVAEVRQLDAAEAMEPTAPERGRRQAWGRRGLLLAGVAILVVAGAGYFYFHRPGRSFSTKPATIRSLAVLPLENLSHDPEQEYLADGMSDELITQLARISGLRVISRTSVMRYKGTRKPLGEIAKELNVDAIVEGAVLRGGDKIRVSIQLIRANTDEHLWANAYDRELRDLLGLQSELAQGISRQIKIVVGAQKGGPVTARTVAPAVYESYLKGRFALHKNTRAGLEEALKSFQAAVDGDATFAPAYAGLAATHFSLGTVFFGEPPHDIRPKVFAEARKALELDPQLAEAHVLLAEALARDWRWKEAEAEYERAIELSPSDAVAHAGFAHWLLCQGRTEEALSWARRAQEIDPLALHGEDIGWILFQSRRYDEAVRELRTVLTVEPEEPFALWFLGFAFIGAEQYDEAIHVLERAASASNRNSAVLGVLVRAYARAGRRTEALRVLDELHRRSRTSYVPPAAFLNAYLGLGDTEEAFKWMGRAAKERSNIMQFLKVHPFFDPLRGDPRFTAFLQQANFE